MKRADLVPVLDLGDELDGVHGLTAKQWYDLIRDRLAPSERVKIGRSLYVTRENAPKIIERERNNPPARVKVAAAHVVHATPDMPFVIIRGRDAGVHAGYLESLDRATKSCVLRGARRIWYWFGAASLSELAVYGASKPADCRFGARIDRQEIIGDVCEVIHCQDRGSVMIRTQPEWRA